jgi:hypothetical protein
MDIMEQILNDAMASVPRLKLEKLILKKLKSQGAKFPRTLPRRLAEHVLSGTERPFQFRARPKYKDLAIEFSDADAEEIARELDNFLNVALPELVNDYATRISKQTLKDLKGRWPEEQRRQQADISGFRDRMEETWGEPLARLRMLLTIAKEWGGEAHQEAGDDQLKKLMVRLLVRSCQVTDEIICLLENGFADGAMARWRTLHEIAIVAAFIAKHGPNAVERYRAHQAVDSRRAMRKYIDCYKVLGYRPLGVRTEKRIEKRYQAAITKYGAAFKGDYGWAAYHLKKPRPTFADLEADVGYGWMRAHYQMGNDNVHAGIKSMYVRLGLLTDYDTLLAGRSNAGLTEPAQNAALTLTKLAVLVCLSPKLDDVVAGNIMQGLQEEIPTAFARADRRLQRKHKAFQESEAQRGAA